MKTQLDYVYEHEKNTGDRVWLTQPMGKGEVVEITWKRALDEARRMAAHLEIARLPEGEQHRPVLQEQRVVVPRRPRDLDGGARLGPALPHAHAGLDRADPRP
jgi:hypothetical protein